MRHPVERVKRFIADQRQQARYDHARAVWARRVTQLAPGLEELVTAFREGLATDLESGTAISVRTDPRRDAFALVVAFEPRTLRGLMEVGASALFRCEPDGKVHGFRYPFHSTQTTLPPEPFVILGEPHSIPPEKVGHAVVDFLEWAAVGEGCGLSRLRFWSPTPSVQTAPPPLKLAVFAA
jgi:hypothetical protein